MLFLSAYILCRLSFHHKDQTLFHLLALQEPHHGTCHLQFLTSWTRGWVPSVPELPASMDSFTAFYPNSVWPYRHVITTQCHSTFPASGLRGNQRKKSWSWGENAFLRHGFFHQVESTCLYQTLALEKSLTRKGREPSPAGSEAIPRLYSSQICLWREVMCVVRGGENRG